VTTQLQLINIIIIIIIIMFHLQPYTLHSTTPSVGWLPVSSLLT